MWIETDIKRETKKVLQESKGVNLHLKKLQSEIKVIKQKLGKVERERENGEVT